MSSAPQQKLKVSARVRELLGQLADACDRHHDMIIAASEAADQGDVNAASEICLDKQAVESLIVGTAHRLTRVAKGKPEVRT
ncbi:hypothetical protein [Allorhodopirellula heiligendammensis]|uniref:Uncharacterized protein n=1 Tax=Allorhodopirellula heiligendammensis TaxID=2714739 RepID=A0A5C6C1H3_9BACT|nr:hypothetical protein [Allorhodopirellula heiligendammensis]TWU18018.1 hypothetical protein Poly21_01710 [Allorhodopirellula heiligendammensis]